MKTSNSHSDVNKQLGNLGESNVCKALRGIKAKFLSNLYVPYNGSTTEVDIIAICPHMIYVIEVKNYRGFIYGDEGKEYWVQRSRNQCNTFYNPIKQNEGHINALRQFIKEPMTSIVVFSDISKIQVESKSIVIQTKDIKKTVEDIESKSQSNVDIDEVYNVLKAFSNSSEKTQSDHLNDLTKRQSCDII